MMMLNESFIDGYDIDIEPDDIEQEDIVTMVWSIAQSGNIVEKLYNYYSD